MIKSYITYLLVNIMVYKLTTETEYVPSINSERRFSGLPSLWVFDQVMTLTLAALSVGLPV